MRKANKIIMATVAILLCLVLITTSVASGIFAKFVITKSGEATITFERFGVTVTMSIPSTPADKSFTSVRDITGVEVSDETFSSTGHTITISGLKMRPGMDFSKAVRFDFSGILTVAANLKITTTVEYDAKVHTDTQNADKTITYHNYYVPADTIIQSTASNGAITYMPQTYFMPIGFLFSYDYHGEASVNSNVVLGSWTEDTSIGTNSKVIASAVSNSIASGVADRIEDTTATKPSKANKEVLDKNVITFQTFAKGEEIKFKINTQTEATSTFFHMGFFYPLDRQDADKGRDNDFYSKLATYIAEHTDPDCAITVSYTVELVQT